MTPVLHSDDIWAILARHLKAGLWTPLSDIYLLVEQRIVLDDEDMQPDSRGSSSSRWKRNVRNVLQRRKTEGDLDWDGAGRV